MGFFFSSSIPRPFFSPFLNEKNREGSFSSASGSLFPTGTGKSPQRLSEDDYVSLSAEGEI